MDEAEMIRVRVVRDGVVVIEFRGLNAVDCATDYAEAHGGTIEVCDSETGDESESWVRLD